MDENVTASLTKHRRTTLERIEKYISDKYFTDVNLYGKLYSKRKDVTSIKHWKVPGDVGEWMNWPFKKILAQMKDFSPVKIGDKFGPSWSTHWFVVEFDVPGDWKGEEVRLRFKSQSEAMVWSMDGVPLQGLSSGTNHQLRTEFQVSKKWDPTKEKSKQQFMIEMAGSKMFGVGKNGMINPPNPDESFTLEAVEIVVLDTDVYSSYLDLDVLHDFAKTLEKDQRGYLALYAGNQIVNDLIKGDKKHAHTVARNFFSKKNGQTALTMALFGHCHIDSAWLWPYSETIRKCGRSWSAVIRLMDDYPDMVFACSQAQQYDWVKQYYPALYDKIKEKNKAGQFLHIGATWVEMDGLIPSGESFMRQFLYGQKFYKEEFGSESTVFWLPDTFGYSAQIPQICKQFKIPYFLTQKLSWNLVNKFPHHTFLWEGIDGTTLLTHFPPGDSYEMNVEAREAIKTADNSTDKGRVEISGFLYGYGDGGGGPTQDMLERAKRLADVDGCPKMKHMTPLDMFTKMDADRRNLCKWVGELYLELHNGTYTSQANTKLFNRRCEIMLRSTEILLSMSMVSNAITWEQSKEKRAECEKAWKKVLLNQFHDVLPGSSIGLVYQDSDKLYKEALVTCHSITQFCTSKLVKGKSSEETDNASIWVSNFLPWDVNQIIEVQKNKHLVDLGDRYVQASAKDLNMIFIVVSSPAFSFANLNLNPSSHALETDLQEARLLAPPKILIEKHGNDYMMENQFISAYISSRGELTQLINKKNQTKDVFDKSIDGHKGNILTMYDDVPLFWDAWDVMDYHVETRTVLNSKENDAKIKPLVEVEHGPLKAELEIEMDFGANGSHWYQSIIMTAVDPYITFANLINWRESHKFLKVEFDTNIISEKASYEIQFGHIERPTHRNTSWDWAKYEVSGHKWANISEFNRGISVLNDSKYGWSAKGGTLALSLLRAPKAPDDNCDIGEHSFNYAVMPHAGTLQESGSIQASYEFNSKLRFGNGAPNSNIAQWMKIIGEGVMIEAVKVAEGGDRAVVARLYEMNGGSSDCWLKISFKVKKVYECFGNEDVETELTVVPKIPDDENKDGKYCYTKLSFGAFQIKTIKLVPA